MPRLQQGAASGQESTMTHPLTTKISGSYPSLFPRTIGRLQAAVTVEYLGNKTFAVQIGGFTILRDDTYVVEIPKDYKIIDPNEGLIIEATQNSGSQPKHSTHSMP
jgi:hypothetical protein